MYTGVSYATLFQGQSAHGSLVRSSPRARHQHEPPWSPSPVSLRRGSFLQPHVVSYPRFAILFPCIRSRVCPLPLEQLRLTQSSPCLFLQQYSLLATNTYDQRLLARKAINRVVRTAIISYEEHLSCYSDRAPKTSASPRFYPSNQSVATERTPHDTMFFASPQVLDFKRTAARVRCHLRHRTTLILFCCISNTNVLPITALNSQSSSPLPPLVRRPLPTRAPRKQPARLRTKIYNRIDLRASYI